MKTCDRAPTEDLGVQDGIRMDASLLAGTICTIYLQAGGWGLCLCAADSRMSVVSHTCCRAWGGFLTSAFQGSGMFRSPGVQWPAVLPVGRFSSLCRYINVQPTWCLTLQVASVCFATYLRLPTGTDLNGRALILTIDNTHPNP